MVLTTGTKPQSAQKRGGGYQAEVSKEVCFGKHFKELCGLKSRDDETDIALAKSLRIQTGYSQAGFDARFGLEMGMFDSLPKHLFVSLFPAVMEFNI